ncbi:MAG: hypothetical protein EP338_00500 [Bacteroidetes bacterium]|nr:MAG: hypothetical protein EP338_00500 [Bacteroidota bacterium]
MHKSVALVSLLFISSYGWTQLRGSISGNAETTFQYLKEDSLIGATQPSEKGLLNSYMNVFYTGSNFKAGMRIESYLPRIQGYPDRFDGTGLGMRYVGYQNDYLDLTLGNFYEQFGAGMIFRSYEDRNLGYDNVMDGIRLIFRPRKGLKLTGVYGRQRLSFTEGKVIKGDGLVRGLDADLNVNQFFSKLSDKQLQVGLGGSFVSKYQVDNNDTYVLPENVGSYGGRINLRYKKFAFNAEYIHKENDPSDDNGYIYNSGHAALFNLTYTKKGLGIIVSGKSVNNMSFRSDRTKDLQDVFVNFLPAMNKTHTYNLVATLYPYTTQPLGEVAYQAEVLYTVKRGSKLGGKYGLPINVNFSTAFNPVKHPVGSNQGRIMYEGHLFDMSDSLFWQDFNINVTKKVNKSLKFIASYYSIRLNNDATKVTNFATGIINSHIGVLEINKSFGRKHSVRLELQGLFTKQDKGNWFTTVAEYNISPKWFFGLMDQYNYGNPHSEQRIHYLIGTFGFIKSSSRFMVSYGRQRAGLFCVGGICRFVPASNGLTFSFTHSF